MSTLQRKKSKLIQNLGTNRIIEDGDSIPKDIINDSVNIQKESFVVEEKDPEKKDLDDLNDGIEQNSTNHENPNRIIQYVLELKNEMKTNEIVDNSQISKNIEINLDQTVNNSPIFSKLSIQPSFQFNMLLKDFDRTKIFYKKKLGFNLIKENQEGLLVFKIGDVILSFSINSKNKTKNLPPGIEIVLKTKINLQDFLQLCKDREIEIMDSHNHTVPEWIKIRDPNGYIFSIVN